MRFGGASCEGRGWRGGVGSLGEQQMPLQYTTLSLLQELLQVHTCLQLQDSELKRLQQAAQAPEKEALQVGCVSWETTSPGVRAAVSWTLSPTQPLLLRPGPRVPLRGPPCPCWSSWEGPWPALSSPLHLAVPQPAEPEPDAGSGQEVTSVGKVADSAVGIVTWRERNWAGGKGAGPGAGLRAGLGSGEQSPRPSSGSL